MVKTEQRGADHKPFDAGLSRVEEAPRSTEKRIAPHKVGSAIETEALDWMLQQCGGDVRGLMKYVQAATAFVEEPPISREASVRAVNQTAATFAASNSRLVLAKVGGVELGV